VAASAGLGYVPVAGDLYLIACTSIVAVSRLRKGRA
jgi:hypothetical protein